MINLFPSFKKTTVKKSCDSEGLKDKFLRYIQIPTQSMEDADIVPSTKEQFDLAKLLVVELQDFNISDAKLDKYCNVYAHIPSNMKNDAPPVGFIAHLDTSPSVKGDGVNPQVIDKYLGGDIILCADKTQVIRVDNNPHLNDNIGETIITTDGTTLLGADDKAGVAIIMQVAEILATNPEIKHGDIYIAFTPDEEVGCGTTHFDLDEFKAKYAYTIDAESPGEISIETFNASRAIITFKGENTHPGYAKNKMINSLYAASYFVDSIPNKMKPENSDGKMGYIHPMDIKGNEEETVIKMILRDFEEKGITKREAFVKELVENTQKKFPKVVIDLKITHQYKNMKYEVLLHPQVLNIAKKAIKMAGLKPIVNPIRGGTDGAMLTYKGIPTPNIFTGGSNAHSKLEWVSLKYMEKSVETLLNIIHLFSGQRG